MKGTSAKKDKFQNRIGFVLAAAGSAVGLGNIWRFPYLAAKHGGGIFLLIYLILVLTFGYSLLLTENALGRLCGRGPVGTYQRLVPGKGFFRKFLRAGGWLNALVPMLILPYYCVIGGWVTYYVYVSATVNPASLSKDATGIVNGQVVSASKALFVNFLSSPVYSGIAFGIFAFFTVLLVVMGVRRGVEQISKILLPLLFILLFGLCIYTAFLPGYTKGLYFYLVPDWHKFSFYTVLDALGQLFFSISIGMGIMFTYGSYMQRKDDLDANARTVELFDTLAAFLAGLLIIPALVAFGGAKAAEASGPGLLFISMPQVVASMPGGRIVGFAFFLLVFFATLTSAVSVLETNVSTIKQEFGLSRGISAFICTVDVIVLGVLTLLGYSLLSSVRPLCFLSHCANMDILDSLDYLTNNLMMPLAVLFTAFLVVFAVGVKKVSDSIKKSSPNWHREKLYRITMRFIVIPALILILLYSLVK